ncbi:hypothetical protein G7068_05610 [Leucobacter viscericola]|uniref:Uncharacterized protein n=1 Tax=Leucobacter viscericola TaxID=2714935 RepID=A0A6G7XB26_9MICO|nr:hypothetical protein [Leucobacter viscericola]QIK61765.1 hypothetical protein G7068_05610 [Leucobacter viscericola]
MTPPPAANAATQCPPTATPTTPPSTTPPPTTPPPTTPGVVTAVDITGADWTGSCEAGATSCELTVDLSKLAISTTNKDAVIDWSTFAVTNVPSGYSFGTPTSTGVLTVTVSTTSPPSALPSYTLRDSTGQESNVASIGLPTIPVPPFQGVDVVMTQAEFDPDGYRLFLDMNTVGLTPTAPNAVVDWSTFDLDPGTPGVQSSVVFPAAGPLGSDVDLTMSFDTSTHVLSVWLPYSTAVDWSRSYVVSDSLGNMSTPGIITMAVNP